jgi:hypothetical protein
VQNLTKEQILKVFGHKVLGVLGHKGTGNGKGENYLKEVGIIMVTNSIRLYQVKHIVLMGKT